MGSAFDQAYFKIRDMINSGELQANDALVPEDLARMCGVSRTPVREAILRLEAEMFVTRLDNKRTVVRSWSSDEISVFVELRTRVGGLVAAEAASHIDDAALDELEELNTQLAAMIADGAGVNDVRTITWRFHELIIAATKSDRLTTISQHLVNPAPLLRLIERNSDQSMADMLGTHRELTAALRARDSRWAEAAMVAYVRKTYRPDVLARLKAATADPDYLKAG